MSQVSHPLFGRIAVGSRLGEIPARTVQALALAAVAGFAAVVLYYFHDRFWWGPSDGAYAHVAERILAGEVLNRDVQDIHAGYINFANAAAMAIFGSKLVALRYPLVLLTFIQTCLVFFFLLPRGTAMAVAGGVTMAALSFVQFLEPTANWYALFLSTTLIAALIWIPRRSPWRLLAVGFLLMGLFLFRQLSGVLVGIGVLTYLLCEAPPSAVRPRRSADLWLSRGLLGIMGTGLTVYLLAKTTPFATALYGLGPLAIMVWAGVHGNCRNRETAAMMMYIFGGAVLALAPLLGYHLINGSVSDWIGDTVVVAFSLTQLPFFERSGYGTMLLYLALSAGFSADPASVVNGGYMVVLILLAPVTAVVTLLALRRHGAASGARPYLLPVLALFHALGALHYQVLIYLMYTVALTFAGFLRLCAEGPSWARRGSLGLALFLSATGLYFQAGQPMSREWSEVAAGVRVPTFAAPGIKKAGVRMDSEDAADYEALVALIERETPADGAILVLPVNPELYFLSGRRNPTRFFNSAFGLRTQSDLRSVLGILRRDPPALVFFRPDDPYETENGRRLMEYVQARYEPLPSQGGFDIYRYRPNTTIYRPQLGVAP